MNLRVVTKLSTALRLEWSPPSSSNTHVEFYLLKYRELEPLACMSGPGSWSPWIEVNADQRRFQIPDLLPYCKHQVMLSASTVAGPGRPAVATATTDVAGMCFVNWRSCQNFEGFKMTASGFPNK